MLNAPPRRHMGFSTTGGSPDFGTRDLVVTGATGWLGRRLVDTLAHGLPEVERLAKPIQNAHIRCLALSGHDGSSLRRMSERVEIVEGDITSREDCRRLLAKTQNAVVFHVAGVIHPRRVEEFYRINVGGTRALLQEAAAAGVRRVVVVSSNSPIGVNPRRDHSFDEESPYHPYMNYGRSKMLMEMVVRDTAGLNGLETVIVRAPWFYGPFQPPRQTTFFKMIRQGRIPIVGDGGNVRSMAYLDNLCQGLMLAALEPCAKDRVYWIADERPYAMREIVDTVERLLDDEFGQRCAHRRVRLPGFVSDLAQAADGMIQAMGAYHEKIHVLSEMNKTIACRVDRARAELGYRPMVSLEEGMRRSIRWCIDNGLL